MAVEVACAKCAGRLIVETFGVVVACPHCGTHLTIQADDPPEDIGAQAAAQNAIAASASSIITRDPVTDIAKAAPQEQQAAEEQTIHELQVDASRAAEAAAATEGAKPDPVEDRDDTTLVEGLGEFLVAGTPSGADFPSVDDAGTTERSTIAATTGGSEKRSIERPAGVSRTAFFLLASYASAVTLALGYLLYAGFFGRSHQLESLPDVRPPKDREGKIVRTLVPEKAGMPRGHTLRVGESRRFGHLLVTPVKVVRGRVRLRFDEDTAAELDRPVLQLRLRLKNVSENQAFIPLGEELLFWSTEKHASKKRPRRANNFIVRESHKDGDAPIVLLYQATRGGEGAELDGQHIDRLLQPGEEFETFLASSEEGLDELTGDIIWRVHLRKGVNLESGYGVTTLIEVAFNDSEIAEE